MAASGQSDDGQGIAMPLADMFPAFAEIGVVTSHDGHQQLLTSCQLCGAAVAVDAEERHHRFHKDRNDLR